MEGGYCSVIKEVASRRPGPREEKLDRALVAGLILEVSLKEPGAPVDPQAHRRLVKSGVQEALVTYLAGWVSLDRFRTLVRNLDHWFAFYYPLVAPPAGPRQDRRPAGPAPVPLTPRAVREDFLDNWLHHRPGMFPQRAHRKLNKDKLREFLRRTQGGWFRLKDFSRFFDIDRKTAWEYLQKYTHAGLFCHNLKRSTKVRYCLASEFLVVRAESLRPRVAKALTSIPQDLAAQMADWLIATGGEAFWEEEVERFLPLNHRQTIITSLMADSLLVEVYRSGQSKMFRLPPQWLQEAEG